MAGIPDFDDLPKVEGMPQGCAWGLWDKDGKKDIYGTLNLLTPEVVAAAAKEVKDGVSISLNWPLDSIKLPMPGRKAPVHNILKLDEVGLAPPGCHGWDDEIEINTQRSSQWDSLVHMAHQPTGLHYNGLPVTREDLERVPANTPTLENWHKRGGLVARGVLVDVKAYKDARGEPFHCNDGYRITAEELETVAKAQGVEFKVGDVLVVRTGATEVMETQTLEDVMKMGGKFSLSGVDGTVDTARWVWNKHFSAVAGDAPAFEAFPPLKDDGSEGSVADLVLHPWFLVMFGMSIGELFDLKALSEYCKKTGRYSFMLTSAPLNHPGLVGSPPNALAIF